MTRSVRPAADSLGTARRRKPVVGFFVDRIDASYQNKLLAALVAATEEVGAALLCFCSGPAHQVRGVPVRHHAFHLATPESIDALVVSTPTLVSAIGHAELSRQIARFQGVPIVSMGAEWAGTASIVLDNADAMQQIVEHLLSDHDCCRIAYVRGPLANTEAQERYRGYVAALHDAGMDPDPQLIVQGDFQPASGAEAVRVLFDERTVVFDALVAANDEMAVAAIHELQRRGVRIPAQVKVTGFDDDVTAQFELPSLSTMRQRISSLALEAVKLAITGMEIDISERLHTLRTELVKRRSCGCPLEREQFSVAAPKRKQHGEHEPALIQQRAALSRQMLEAAPDLLEPEQCEELLDGFFAGLMNKSMTAFIEAWDDVLRVALEHNRELRGYQAVTTALRRSAVPPLIPYPGMLLRAETMLHEARVLLASVIHQRATQLQLQEKRLTARICEVAQSLIVATDAVQLSGSIANHLRDLNIPGCCLAVYEPRFQEGSRNKMRVLLWCRDGQVLPVSGTDQFCFESELVSERYLRVRDGHSAIALPLCFGEEKLGLGIFEVGTRDGTIYEALRAQISAALEAIAHGVILANTDLRRDQLVERAAIQLAELRRCYRAARAVNHSSVPGGVPGEPPTELASKIAQLETTLDELLDMRAHPDTLRAPSRLVQTDRVRDNEELASSTTGLKR